MLNMHINTIECAQMRKQYDQKIAQLYNKRRQDAYDWHTKAWVDDAIQCLENFDPTKVWSTKQFMIAQKYKVGEKDGKKILIIKKMSNHVMNLQMIGMEDYFDTLYEAHVETGHSAHIKTTKYLKSKRIYMPADTLQWVNKYCKICQAQRLGPTKRMIRSTLLGKKNHGFVELINMSETPDGHYKYVMLYRDIASNFMFLKPLVTPHVNEVSERLLILFLEIGFPAVLHTPTNEEFTQAITKNLSIAMPASKVLVGKQMKSKKKSDGVENNLNEWMKIKNSTKWSQGILYVANQMNLSKAKFSYRDGYTAYKGFIGLNPKKGLKLHHLKSTLKNLKYEVDLEKVVGSDDNTSDESSDQTDEEVDEEPIMDIKIKVGSVTSIRQNDLKLLPEGASGSKQHLVIKTADGVPQDIQQEKVPPENKCDELVPLKVSGKPIRIYTRKSPVKTSKMSHMKEIKQVPSTSPTEVASNSWPAIGTNVKTEVQKDNLTYHVGHKNNPSSLNKTTPEQSIIQTSSEAKLKTTTTQVKEETPVTKSLCIDTNLRELNDWKSGCKRKKLEVCISNEIDLPLNTDEDKSCMNNAPININLNNVCVRQFGELQNFETDVTNEDLIFTDFVTSEIDNEHLYRQDSPPFGTIVKVESLHNYVEESMPNEHISIKKEKGTECIKRKVPKKEVEVGESKDNTSFNHITVALPQKTTAHNSEESELPVLKLQSGNIRTYTKKPREPWRSPVETFNNSKVLQNPLLKLYTTSQGNSTETHMPICSIIPPLKRKINTLEEGESKLGSEILKIKPQQVNAYKDVKSKKPNTRQNTKSKQKKAVIKVKLVSKRNVAKPEKITKTKRKQTKKIKNMLTAKTKRVSNKKVKIDIPLPEDQTINKDAIDLPAGENISLKLEPFGIDNYGIEGNFGEISYLKNCTFDEPINAVDITPFNDIKTRKSERKKKTVRDFKKSKDCMSEMIEIEVPALTTIVKIEPIVDDDRALFRH